MPAPAMFALPGALPEPISKQTTAPDVCVRFGVEFESATRAPEQLAVEPDCPK